MLNMYSEHLPNTDEQLYLVNCIFVASPASVPGLWGRVEGHLWLFSLQGWGLHKKKKQTHYFYWKLFISQWHWCCKVANYLPCTGWQSFFSALFLKMPPCKPNFVVDGFPRLHPLGIPCRVYGKKTRHCQIYPWVIANYFLSNSSLPWAKLFKAFFKAFFKGILYLFKAFF